MSLSLPISIHLSCYKVFQFFLFFSLSLSLSLYLSVLALTGKGFTHISMEQFGPNSWKNLPYKSGDKNPVKIVMDLILKAHLSDFGDTALKTMLNCVTPRLPTN